MRAAFIGSEPDIVDGKIADAADQALSKAYPEKSGCLIEATLAEGTTLQASRDYPKGQSRRPAYGRGD